MSRMQRSHRTLLARTLVFLFALNAVSLCLYLLLHPRPTAPPETLAKHHRLPLKPWPALPSSLPWATATTPRSCDAYFGHGFCRRVEPIRPSGAGGWFRCFHSETLASSICEGGRVRMDPGRIQMSRGGERLESVMGRREEEELPKFEPGAFQIEGGGEGTSGDEPLAADRKVVDEEFLDRYVPRGAVQFHTMRELMGSMRLVGPGELECSEWIEDPTILVTRFEYANIFHTITDWYSAYVSSRVTSLPARPHLIFVDGHCKAPLEETWEALFSSIRYAKNFSGPVCFRHAILSPLGYETAMFKGLTESISCHGTTALALQENPDDRKTARLSEFGEMLRAAFGLLGEKPTAGRNVLFVRREDYLAHPRHSGRVESRLSNEQEVFDAVRNWASTHEKCNVNVVNGLFAHMAMREQLRAIQEASVVVGAHGAGLTHLVAATPGTVVLEIISSSYRRPHFALISRWKGLEYHAINLGGSLAEPSRVIDELRSIMGSLGC